jgi:hypothetical protein
MARRGLVYRVSCQSDERTRRWGSLNNPVSVLENYKSILYKEEELDGPAISALRRAVAEVKQRWSVIGWVTKNLLSGTPPCRPC